MEGDRVAADRGPQPRAARPLFPAKFLDAPAGLVGMAQRRLAGTVLEQKARPEAGPGDVLGFAKSRAVFRRRRRRRYSRVRLLREDTTSRVALRGQVIGRGCRRVRVDSERKAGRRKRTRTRSPTVPDTLCSVCVFAGSLDGNGPPESHGRRITQPVQAGRPRLRALPIQDVGHATVFVRSIATDPEISSSGKTRENSKQVNSTVPKTAFSSLARQ